MAMSMLTGIALAVFLVFLNGFFVAAEFALVKVRPTQIDAHVHRRPGRIARHMISHLDAYLSATQLGITLASLGLGWIGEPAVASVLRSALAPFGVLSEGALHSTSLVIGFFLISVLHIILGELAPKSIAIRLPERTALWVALPLFFFYKLSFPLIWLLNRAANAILKLIGVEPLTEGSLAHGEDEIRRLLASSRDSSMPSHQRELLDNVFELSHRVARQVMVPRGEVVYLDTTVPIEDNLRLARESGHTRFPLCDGELDRVVGLIHIKDVFRANEPPTTLAAIKRDILVVPETLPLERVLRRMRTAQVHMAAVIDEYGSVSGIIALENVIEEIVGQIQDEFDAERPELSRIEDNVYQVLGSMLIEDLETRLGLEIDTRDEDTIAGIALSEIGRRPRVGDRVKVGPLDLEVLEVEGHRILALRVRIERPATQGDNAAQDQVTP